MLDILFCFLVFFFSTHFKILWKIYIFFECFPLDIYCFKIRTFSHYKSINLLSEIGFSSKYTSMSTVTPGSVRSQQETSGIACK